MKKNNDKCTENFIKASVVYFRGINSFCFLLWDVLIETKNKMKEALNNPSEPNHIKQAAIDPEVIELKQLDYFVFSHTKSFFEIFGLPPSFLEKKNCGKLET